MASNISNEPKPGELEDSLGGDGDGNTGEVEDSLGGESDGNYINKINNVKKRYLSFRGWDHHGC